MSLPLLAVWLAAAAPAPAKLSPAERAAAKQITAPLLTGHIRFLASDLLEGRAPATRGDKLAQQYIAAQMETLGLVPAGTAGGWYQPFDVVGVEGKPDALTFSAGARRLTLKYYDDFIAVSGTQQPESKVQDAELVFVGYGIVAPEQRWDDFKGADLKGKVLVILNNDPEDDPELFAGRTRLWYGRWDYKYLSAASTGAAGALIIHTTPSAGYDWSVVQSSWSGEQFELPQAGSEPRLQLRGWTTEAATRRLMELAGKDLEALRAAAQRRDFRPVPLGVRLSTAFKNKLERAQTANVLGKWPGRDPKLAAQVVLVTAHHDHLGRKERYSGDDICNGALDNASGVATMLALARAVTSLPERPRRTIVFAGLAGEEQGLLGSEHLAEHPPAPRGALAADINIDGMNIWGRTRDLTVIGLGKSNIDESLVALAATQGRVVKPDQLSDRGFFYRSDQFNFAKAGVPSAYFGSGMDFVGKPEGWGKEQRELWERQHYHQPSDELRPDWDLTGAVEDAQLYFHLAVRLANADAMPAWNKGDEFEGARLKALGELERAK